MKRLLVGGFVVLWLLASVSASQAANPVKLQYAVGYVEEARDSVLRLPNRFKGHKKACVAALDEAQRELLAALQFIGVRDTIRVPPLPGGTPAERLANAIPYFEAAQAEMQQAGHIYGGHRVAAIRALSQAIDELNQMAVMPRGKGKRGAVISSKPVVIVNP